MLLVSENRLLGKVFRETSISVTTFLSRSGSRGRFSLTSGGITQ